MADVLFRDVPEDDEEDEDEKKDNEEEDEEEGEGYSESTPPVSETIYLARLSGFLSRRAELDHSSPLIWRKPVDAPRKLAWNIKLNHVCHESVLQIDSFITYRLAIDFNALPALIRGSGCGQVQH